MFVILSSIVLSFGLKAQSIHSHMQNLVEISPSIQAKKHELAAAEAEYKSAISAAFPSVNFNNNYSEQKNPFGSSFFIGTIKNYTSVFQVQQPLYLGGRIWAGMEIKKQVKDVTKISVQLEQQSVLREFLNSYFNYLKLLEKKQSLQKSLKTQRQFVQLTKNKLKKGSARPYESFQAEAELASYQSRLQQLETQISTVYSSLKEDLQLEKVSDFKYPEKFIEVKSSKSELLQEMLEHNLQLKMAQQQVDVAEAQKSLEVGEHLPSLSLEAQMGWRSPDTSGLFENSNESHTYIVNFSIPIFSGLSSLSTRKASAQKIMQQKKRLQSSQLAASKQFYLFYESYKNAKDVYIKTKNWQRQASLAVRNGLKNFKSGIISNFQVVQLQKGLEAAESAFADATAAYHMSVVDLYFVLGRDLLSLYN